MQQVMFFYFKNRTTKKIKISPLQKCNANLDKRDQD